MIPENVKLGCNPSPDDPRTLKFGDYMTGLSWLKIIPGADWMKALPNPGMLMNDKLGCCVISGAMHMEMYWSRNAGQVVPAPTSLEVVSAYSAIGHYVPGDPSTDRGCDPLTALKYWRRHGLTIDGKTHKIAAFAKVNLKNSQELRAAIWLFGGLFAGWALPKIAQGKPIWDAPLNLSDPDSRPYSWGGHLAPLCEEDRAAYAVSTWGTRLPVTPRFIADYCVEAWAVFSESWISGNGIAPSGFDTAALIEDLGRL